MRWVDTIKKDGERVGISIHEATQEAANRNVWQTESGCPRAPTRTRHQDIKSSTSSQFFCVSLNMFLDFRRASSFANISGFINVIHFN